RGGSSRSHPWSARMPALRRAQRSERYGQARRPSRSVIRVSQGPSPAASLRTLPARGLALAFDQRLHRLTDALAENQHLAYVGRRLLLMPVVQIEHVGDASPVEDGEDQGAERHLLSERGEETNVHGGLLQRAHVVAARLH